MRVGRRVEGLVMCALQRSSLVLRKQFNKRLTGLPLPSPSANGLVAGRRSAGPGRPAAAQREEEASVNSVPPRRIGPTAAAAAAAAPRPPAR
jgi:hypothetical protein